MAYEYQEFPRCLYKGSGETRLVKNDAEKLAAMKDGWSVDPVLAPVTTPDPPFAVVREVIPVIRAVTPQGAVLVDPKKAFSGRPKARG